MNIQEQIKKYQSEVSEFGAKLIAVSKTKPMEDVQTAYDIGQRIFGENKVQELTEKQESLPKDIEWHMIGHLQSNKVKYIAPFVSLIHAVDSIKLLKEINKQALKNNRIIQVLLQAHIAEETNKFGFSYSELNTILEENQLKELHNINVIGLMAIATNTNDTNVIRQEFKTLKSFFDKHNSSTSENINLKELSIGMSNDYKIALEEGATLIRVGSSIFGSRNYN